MKEDPVQRDELDVHIWGPSDGEGANVGLETLAAFLGDLQVSLRKMGQRVAPEANARFLVTALAHGSARLTIRAVADDCQAGGEIIDAYIYELDALQRGQEPAEVDYEVVESISAMVNRLGRGLDGIEFAHGDRTLNVTQRAAETGKRLLRTDLRSHGAMQGYLDAINVHGKHELSIYPTIGRAKVVCRFPEHMLPQVSQALKHYVDVTGVLHYRRGEDYPYLVEIDSLEVAPKQDDLPTLRSLRGMAPAITGGQPLLEYLEEMRSVED